MVDIALFKVGCFRRRRKNVGSFDHHITYLLGHFLHQNAIVPFSGDARVSKGNRLAHPVAGKVALASGAFDTGSGHITGIPSNKRLNKATQGDNILGTGLIHIFHIDVLDPIQNKIKSDGLGHKGVEGILEQIELYNGFAALAIRADGQSLVSETETGLHTMFGTGHTHSSDANSAGKETVSDLQESVTFFLDSGGKLARGVDIGEFVQEGFTWDVHMGEFDACVVHAIEAHFVSQIFQPHTRHQVFLFVSNTHQESVDAFILTFDIGLGEHHGIIGVAGSIGDPVFLRHHSGVVYNEFFFFFVISGSGFHLHGVVAKA